MNDLAATIGLVQMKHAKKVIGAFHANGELYSKLLKDIPGVTLIDRVKESYSTYWTYPLLVENRDRVVAALKAEGIASGIVHPRNDTYSIFSKFKRELPGVDYFSAHEMSLPSGWWVTKEDIEKIIIIIIKTIHQ
jgi:dTDP-4-amino-4,6-dideoxygalactose transaminase